MNSLTVQLPKAARVFLLEDDAERIKWFKDRLPTVTLESTASDAVRTLGTSAPFDYLFLDYDLYLVDRRYGNGGQVARFLAGRGELGENCVIHSLNLGGAAEMKSILRDALVLPYGHFDIALEGA